MNASAHATHPDRLPNYDHDYDGRPPVEYDGYDPLLAALIRAHPEMIPAELIDASLRLAGAVFQF